MTILAGILILMCAGLMVGHGYHMFRHKEPPKKESHNLMMMQRDHDRAGAVESSPERLPEDQKTTGPGP